MEQPTCLTSASSPEARIPWAPSKRQRLESPQALVSSRASRTSGYASPLPQHEPRPTASGRVLRFQHWPTGVGLPVQENQRLLEEASGYRAPRARGLESSGAGPLRAGQA